MPDLDMSPSFSSVAVHFIENFLQMLVSMPEQLDCVLNVIICTGFANCIQLFSEILNSVVLPTPLGPVTATTSPGRTEKDSSRNTASLF